MNNRAELEMALESAWNFGGGAGAWGAKKKETCTTKDSHVVTHRSTLFLCQSLFPRGGLSALFLTVWLNIA